MQFDMKNINQSNEKTMAEHTRRLNFHNTTLRNIEIQVGQLVQESHMRPQGGLPSETMTNPKGKKQYCAIALRSRTMVKNKVERREASEGSAFKKFDVMEEEIQAYSKEKIKDYEQGSLGEQCESGKGFC